MSPIWRTRDSKATAKQIAKLFAESYFIEPRKVSRLRGGYGDREFIARFKLVHGVTEYKLRGPGFTSMHPRSAKRGRLPRPNAIRSTMLPRGTGKTRASQAKAALARRIATYWPS